MALNGYVSATQRLLSNPAAPTTLYSTADIQSYVNTARLQMAGETECVRGIATLAVTGATNTYAFSAVAGLPTGAQAIYSVRQILRVSGTGQVYMGPRPYPWAQLYWLNNAAPVAGTPTEWSQFKIGVQGSLVLDKTPDTSYTLNLDAVLEPSVLTSDGDPELIPDRYTDAIPYFAAYYAYMSAQRQSDADLMYGRYKDFVKRAQMIAVPNILPDIYDQHMEQPAPPSGGGGGLAGLMGGGG